MTKEEIQALIAEALANAGFLSKAEFGATAAMIRGLKDAIDGIKSQNPMDALVAAGLLEKAEDGTYRPKSPAAPAKPGQPEPEWKAELTRMRDQIAAKDRQLEAERKQREEAETKSAVITGLEKAGAVNPSRDYVHVLGQVKRGQDGKFYVPKTNEFGAEEQIALDAAFGEFLKSNPELKKASGHAGSGTPSGAPAGTGRPASNDVNSLAQMSTEQYFAARAKAN